MSSTQQGIETLIDEISIETSIAIDVYHGSVELTNYIQGIVDAVREFKSVIKYSDGRRKKSIEKARKLGLSEEDIANIIR